MKSFTRNMLCMESGTQWQFSSPRSQLSAISTGFHWNLGVLNLKLLIPGQNISLPAYFASKIGMQLYSVPVCEITPFFPFYSLIYSRRLKPYSVIKVSLTWEGLNGDGKDGLACTSRIREYRLVWLGP